MEVTMRRFLPFATFLSVAILSYTALPQGKTNATASQKKGAAHPAHPACTNTGPFTTTCNPFGADKKAHAVDKTCTMTGDAKSAGDQEQDKQKNNLCSAGTPHVIAISDLKTLQADVDKSGVNYGNVSEGHQGPPADRATLFTKLSPGSAKE